MQRLIIIIAFTTLFNGESFSQTPTPEKGYALIFPKGGDGYSAQILRVEKDSVIIFTNELKYVAKKDIGKITSRIPKQTGKGFVIGSTLGLYTCNYLFGTANGQPSPFLAASIYENSNYRNTSGYSVAGIILMGFLVGGGIGYLTDANPTTSSSETYLFGVNDGETAKEWERLSDVVESKQSTKKIHLTIAAGNVIANTHNELHSQLTAQGYTRNSNYYSDHLGSYDEFRDIQEASRFNWLRTAAVQYSITDHLLVGIAYASLDEPITSWVKFSSSQSQGDSSRIYRIREKQTGTGWYVTGSYQHSIGKRKEFTFSATAGLGYVHSHLNLYGDYATSSNYSWGPASTKEFYDDKKQLSGMLGGEVAYAFYDIYSFGISSHYFFAGSTISSPMPHVGLQEQKINYGNGDIGFTIGVHF